ncbi:putative carboxylesterase SOBER1-like isoform X1 [Carex rostrata]
MASFILWLHGSGDSGPANESIKEHFTDPVFKTTKWGLPTAPSRPITVNRGAVMPAWFDVTDVPITSKSVRHDEEVFSAVKDVHSMIDKQIANGINPNNVFVCGFSQGGALAIASVLLYPRTLGGGIIFSGSMPLNPSIKEQVVTEATKTPILWLHGTDDQIVLFEAGEFGCKFLQELGMSCEFKAYPGLGHSLMDDELEYFSSWLRSRLLSGGVVQHKRGCCSQM